MGLVEQFVCVEFVFQWFQFQVVQQQVFFDVVVVEVMLQDGIEVVWIGYVYDLVVDFEVEVVVFLGCDVWWQDVQVVGYVQVYDECVMVEMDQQIFVVLFGVVDYVFGQECM